MQVKIFSGPPAEVEQNAAEWMQQTRHRIQQGLQSQSTTAGGNVNITLTFLFEEQSTGTGLGFRRNA